MAENRLSGHTSSGGLELAQELAAAGDYASIPALLARNVREFGDAPAYREKEFGIWQSWTWAETADEVRALALGLLVLGIERGDHVAIIQPAIALKHKLLITPAFDYHLVQEPAGA